MYDVNGWPSMVISTRRFAASGVTSTPFDAASTLAVQSNPAARRKGIARLRIHLSSRHHLLRLLIEGHLHARLDRGHVHAQRDGMAVAGFDRRIGRLARAHALHPV